MYLSPPKPAGEVGEPLVKDPGVLEAAVVGVPDRVMGEEVKVGYRPQGGRHPVRRGDTDLP